jgi:hypothetical protein
LLRSSEKIFFVIVISDRAMQATARSRESNKATAHRAGHVFFRVVPVACAQNIFRATQK